MNSGIRYLLLLIASFKKNSDRQNAYNCKVPRLSPRSQSYCNSSPIFSFVETMHRLHASSLCHITEPVLDVPQVNKDIEATQYACTRDTWSTIPDFVIRNTTVSGTYNISAQLCIPDDGDKKDYLQIATHGLAFDKRY